VAEVLQTLEAKGHRVNASCGSTYTSAGNGNGPARPWPAWSPSSPTSRRLYAITGSKNRERGTFCGGVRKYGNDKAAKPNLDRNRYTP